MVFLVPMWKAALDTDLRAQNRSTPVKEIVEGRSFHQPLGGFVGVANVGLDDNWLHHPMAMANLYGFGKLAWDPNLSADEIVDAWTRLTWGNDPMVVATIDDLQRNSWHAYEAYSGPLGMGTLTNILGIHYGPGIESAERNGWGQWFRGDSTGIGMDRTVATGTGYIGQYPPELARQYESLATCPDELLLFMHHVTYSYVLHSGKTVVQHVRCALRGRRDGCDLCAALAAVEGTCGRSAVRRDAAAVRVPGWPRGGVARCGDRVVPAHLRNPGCAWPRRPLPESHRG
jgi:alpha-glucuronidase